MKLINFFVIMIIEFLNVQWVVLIHLRCETRRSMDGDMDNVQKKRLSLMCCMTQG